MQFYPGYKLKDVLDEYAVSFLALLNEAYRIKYAHYLMLAQLEDLPNMDQDQRVKFYKNLEWASMHPDDILKTDSQGSSPADIKKLLGG